MLEELARDLLPDVARADDQRVLDVGIGAATQRARHESCEHDEDDREEPEEAELREARGRDSGHVDEREQHPGADREHVEDADEVVDSRVVRTLFVSGVEAVEAPEDDPERE